MSLKNQIELVNKLRELEERFGHEINKANFFVAAGLFRQEIRHSSVLAFLLDPRGWHGLGDYMLRHIVSVASQHQVDYLDEKPEASAQDDVKKSDDALKPKDALKIAFAPINDATVSTEISVGGDSKSGRLDILVKSAESNMCLVVENKVDSKQGKDQLDNYRAWIKQREDFAIYKYKLYVYLTLDEADEPEKDEEKRYWARVTYNDLADFLEKALVVKESSISENGQIFIKQYIDLIKNHIMGNDSNELKDYCERLWQNFDSLLKKVVEYEPTPSKDAIKALMGMERNGVRVYEEIASSRDKLCFLPTELAAVMPKVKVEKGGWGWPDPGFPLRYEFSFEDQKDGSQNLKLQIYVGPSVNRNKLIEAIQKTGLKPTGKHKQNTSKYAKVWDAHPEDITGAVGSEIVEKMKKLLNNAEENNVVKNILKALDGLSHSSAS